MRGYFAIGLFGLEKYLLNLRF